MRSLAASFAPLLALFAACSSPQPNAPTTMTPELQATKVKALAMPLPGLLTAGQPDEAQFEQLAKLGVKNVVCLRPADEDGTGWEEAKAKALGVRFVRLPVAGEGDVTVERAKQLATELGAGSGTTLVCCASSNRVGALLAMKAFHVDGKPAAEALALGKAAGLVKLEAAVQAKLK